MGKTATKKSSDADHRKSHDRPFVSIGVEDFAKRKGTTRAIQACKKRKEKRKTDAAKALRYYKKAMKQEGYEPGTGASRKRPAEQDDDPIETKGETGGRRHKANPFQKSIRKAQERKQHHESVQKNRESGEKERERKLKERQQRSKRLGKRTQKGQPVMKYVVQDLLSKIEKT